MTIAEIVDGFRRECSEDYVDLWQISRAVEELSGHPGLEQILTIAAELLKDGGVVVGQFENGHFVKWSGSVQEQIIRIRRELHQLGGVVDIGDVAWLVSKDHMV